jgi:hypothetical protein
MQSVVGHSDRMRTARRGSTKRRARPRGSTVPRRPYGALGQRGPLGPAPLRFGPPAARGDERAGLRGRPLIVTSYMQGSWEGPRPLAHITETLTLQTSPPEPRGMSALPGRRPVSSAADRARPSRHLSRTRVLVATTGSSGQNHSPRDRTGGRHMGLQVNLNAQWDGPPA